MDLTCGGDGLLAVHVLESEGRVAGLVVVDDCGVEVAVAGLRAVVELHGLGQVEVLWVNQSLCIGGMSI